ncbi:MAG TPA: DUF4386 domain-containing protein [Ktedonosporobacter sp.]|nr:DUF4386 domain-containing protein [Ktedonosporobacter sp.]
MNTQPEARSGPRDHKPETGDSHVREWTQGASPQRWARMYGGLYVINIVFGFFAIGYLPAALIVSGNAAATAQNIQAHELLYRLGLVAHIIVVLTNIPMTLIFYEFFKVVNRRLALLDVFFALVATAIEGANLLNQFAPLLLLGGGHSLSVFTPQQVQALASLPLDLQQMSYTIQQVFYACDLLTAGYLIFRSTFVPRAVGVGLWIGALCYLTYSFVSFLAPGFAAHLVPYIQLPSGLAEFSLCLWFLVMGVNVSRWEKQASQASELESRASGSAVVS